MVFKCLSVIVQNVSQFCQSISTYSVYCNYVITYNTIHIRQIAGVKLFFSSQSTVKVPPFLCFYFSLCWTSQISRELIGSENGARYLHQSRGIVKQYTVSVNKPFSSCPQPPFQNEGRCQIYAFHLSELTGQTIPVVMRILLLIKTIRPGKSNPRYYERRKWFFSKNS